MSDSRIKAREVHVCQACGIEWAIGSPLAFHLALRTYVHAPCEDFRVPDLRAQRWARIQKWGLEPLRNMARELGGFERLHEIGKDLLAFRLASPEWDISKWSRAYARARDKRAEKVAEKGEPDDGPDFSNEAMFGHKDPETCGQSASNGWVCFRPPGHAGDHSWVVEAPAPAQSVTPAPAPAPAPTQPVTTAPAPAPAPTQPVTTAPAGKWPHTPDQSDEGWALTSKLRFMAEGFAEELETYIDKRVERAVEARFKKLRAALGEE